MRRPNSKKGRNQSLDITCDVQVRTGGFAVLSQYGQLQLGPATRLLSPSITSSTPDKALKKEHPILNLLDTVHNYIRVINQLFGFRTQAAAGKLGYVEKDVADGQAISSGG